MDSSSQHAQWCGYTPAAPGALVGGWHAVTALAGSACWVDFDCTNTGLVTKTVDYSFGHDEITQTTREYDAQGNVTSDVTLVFGQDGHGNVRVLTDLAAAVVQLFVFDAYGQMLAILNGDGQLQSGGNGTSHGRETSSHQRDCVFRWEEISYLADVVRSSERSL